MKTAAFVGTRFAGTDGVSLETAKWARILQELGFESVYFCGQSDRPAEHSYIAEEAFFEHPDIAALQDQCFRTTRRTREITAEIQRLVALLKGELYLFIERFKPDVLIPQNALAIPMNIPLGVALTEVIAETALPVIAHHHDFSWERDRFRVSAVDDYLSYAFPPALPGMHHVVINREAQRQLALRRGAPAAVVPNVFDFSLWSADHPQEPIPFPTPDSFNQSLRHELGIRDNQLLILQPTRIIARKGIEHTIELAAQLHDHNPVVVIPHHERDEGDSYAERVVEYAKTFGVELIVNPQQIGLHRVDPAHSPSGNAVFSLWDLYVHADLVTFPSLYEGFGNAFVEAVSFGKPVVVQRYSVYREDIEPLGFHTVTIDGYLREEDVTLTRQIIADQTLRTRWVEENYRIAAQHFSYSRLNQELSYLVSRIFP